MAYEQGSNVANGNDKYFVGTGYLGSLQATSCAVDPNVTGANEQGGFAEVFRTHYDYVWRTLFRLGARSYEVEDLTQDVFLTAYRRFSSYDHSKAIKPWLFGIARNTLWDYRRLLRVKNEIPTENLPEMPSLSQDQSDAMLLRQALLQLDEPKRSLVILHDLEDVDVKDACATLELNLNTGYAYLRQARAELQKIIERLEAE